MTNRYLEISRRIADLFAIRFFELETAILAGSLEQGELHSSSFPGDLVGLEAFVNHFHLEDIFEGVRLKRRAKRREALHIGEKLVEVWSERLKSLLRGRAALFFLGGEDDVVLRFHVERSNSPWMSITDPASLRHLQIQVFRCKDGDVIKLS